MNNYTSFIKSAEQGDTEAQIHLGRCYYSGKEGMPQDYKKAVHWFRRAAEQNSGEGQYLLGVCYLNGKGISRNYPLYRYWFSKSATNGGPASAFGFSYQLDEDFDYSKDLLDFIMEAEQGNAEAQINLGYCYQYGKGVEKDTKKAMYWYNKAEELDHSTSPILAWLLKW